MGNWVICGIKDETAKDNDAVNLDLCYSVEPAFLGQSGKYAIRFKVTKEITLLWKFDDEETRNAQFSKVLAKLK